MNARELLDVYGADRDQTTGHAREEYAPKTFAALRAVLAELDAAEHQATRWAQPLPVPPWIPAMRIAITTALEAP